MYFRSPPDFSCFLSTTPILVIFTYTTIKHKGRPSLIVDSTYVLIHNKMGILNSMDAGDLIEKYFTRLKPEQKRALRKLGIRTIRDLLYHFPARYERAETSERLQELPLVQR